MTLPENWSEYLLEHPLPVRRAIHQGMCRELLSESPDFPRLVGWLRRDPAAASFVLGAAASGQRQRERSAPHNLEHALSLLGSNWARNQLPTLPILENTIDDEDQRAGYLAASSRAMRAARLTEAWLIERRETNYEMVSVAALLHNLVELALWRDAPELARHALAIARKSLIDFTRNDAEDASLDRCFSVGHAFATVLGEAGIDLLELETALTERYYLPVMLLAEEATIPTLGAHHEAILVLARRLAFASEFGWHHAVIRRLTIAIAEQLHLSPTAAWRVTVKKSLVDAREFANIPLYHPGRLLVQHDDGRDLLWPLPADYGLDADENDCHASVKPKRSTTPGRQLGDTIRQLTRFDQVEEIALYENVDASVSQRRFHWSRSGQAALPEAIGLDQSPLLSRLQSRLETLGIDEQNRERLAPHLDTALKAATRAGLVIAPLSVNGTLISTLFVRGPQGEQQRDIISSLDRA
ncbi:HDOD domain-containing protein [Guyparkeria halophila]|uniref:HDOD domain-containing protein n=1 Tax=Guyparkeria halophila TaxID=47960 RepID=A0A6I6CVX7_9GAMM|nr:HDOD domain-containing protein [Guyparkeria halophila]QGT78576.1 HDOD domain-containing protein [Guyparkeria halophila]